MPKKLPIPNRYRIVDPEKAEVDPEILRLLDEDVRLRRCRDEIQKETTLAIESGSLPPDARQLLQIEEFKSRAIPWEASQPPPKTGLLSEIINDIGNALSTFTGLAAPVRDHEAMINYSKPTREMPLDPWEMARRRQQQINSLDQDISRVASSIRDRVRSKAIHVDEWCPTASDFFSRRPLPPLFWVVIDNNVETWHLDHRSSITLGLHRKFDNRDDVAAIEHALDLCEPCNLLGFCLFGNSMWELNSREEHHSKEELRLVLLDAVDKERRKFERLRSRYDENGSLPCLREPIPEDVRIFVWRRDEGKCVRCGSNRNLEFDHIIPVSKGGSATGRNIQLLCETCNREKSDHI